jgi:predicted aminopeptidase
LSQRMRDFAVAELHLPDNASYRRYADLHRPAAVWNVVAAPELGLTLRTSCFPVVGCVGYRGYFDRAAADAQAAAWRAAGDDATVYGVPAYSTLGRLPGAWFADPLLNTFIDDPDIELARLIFHELAHQVVYAAGDTVFNESFASTVERLGAARWAEAHADAAARAESAARDARRRDFRALTGATRQALDALYRSPASDADKRAGKAALLARMRADHQALKAGAWHGWAGYDGWFARANNASLAVLGAYDDLVPGFERVFEAAGRDWERFYAEARRLAGLPAAQRAALLAR